MRRTGRKGEGRGVVNTMVKEKGIKTRQRQTDIDVQVH